MVHWIEREREIDKTTKPWNQTEKTCCAAFCWCYGCSWCSPHEGPVSCYHYGDFLVHHWMTEVQEEKEALLFEQFVFFLCGKRDCIYIHILLYIYMYIYKPFESWKRHFLSCNNRQMVDLLLDAYCQAIVAPSKLQILRNGRGCLAGPAGYHQASHL